MPWPRGKPYPQEARDKISAAKKGCRHSAETRAMISAKLKGRTLPPEHKAKVVAANQARALVPHSYYTRHRELRRRLGPARNHRCVGCGKPAAQWSLNERKVPAKFLRVQRWALKGTTYLVLYSIGPDSHYSPRCLPCHKEYDR